MRKLTIIAVTTVVFFNGLCFTSAVHAQGGTCFKSPLSEEAFECSGQTDNSIPSNSDSSLVRPPWAKGVVDPKVVLLREISDRGEIAPSELVREVCRSGNRPPEQTRNLCWVPTPRFDDDEEDTPAGAREATAWVEQWFRHFPLPTPTPKMTPPKGGVCGVVHVLDLHMAPEAAFVTDTPHGRLSLYATPTIVVDWGDGSTGVHRRTRGIFPDIGPVHHWTDVGRYDITVVATWTADWKIDDVASGRVGGARTSGTLSDWPVFELQARIIDEESRFS